MKAINLDWFFSFRNYNPYTKSYNIVEKTFNRGMGSLALFRFYADKKIILINQSLYNNTDKERLDQFIKDNNLNDWEKRFIYYGYPVYYLRSFSID